MGTKMRPLMTDEEIACLRRYLASASVYLEFGAGGSTAIAADAGLRRVVSVEVDANWVKKCEDHPSIAREISAGRLHFKLVDIGPIKRWGKPVSTETAIRWPSYYLAPWEDLADDLPDFVLIDGRFRLACAYQVMLRCPPQTLFAIHDFQRYQSTLHCATIVERVGQLAVLRRSPTAGFDDVAKAAFQRLFKVG
jgi:hypothetical protein